MACVFLSYDRDNSDKARRMALALEKASHSVWWDLHVRGGAQFAKVIEEALKTADAVVVLWSRQSIESAWVTDEAAAGRDSGRLIPVSLDGTPPPMGFRQFQTIDFSSWKGRTKSVEFQALLAAVDAHEPGEGEKDSISPPVAPIRSKMDLGRGWPIGAAIAMLVVILGASLFIWQPWNRAALAVVTVRSSDQSAASQALARDLMVQLGTLRPVLSNSMQLVDTSPEKSEKPDLVFQAAALPEGGGASLVLSDSRGELLWSKQFDEPNTSPADRRQQIAFTAAGVLRCALDESSGKYGRLPSETRQAYLDACAASGDVDWDTRSLIKPLRQVTEGAPNFRPGWAKLLLAEESAVSLPGNGDAAETRRALRQDIKRVRHLFPDMAEATAAQLAATPSFDIQDAVALLEKAKSQDPDNAPILLDHAVMMSSVGRVAEGLDDLQRAAQLDPLSPVTRKYLIRALVYAGHPDGARAELGRAKQLWPGSETIREADGTIEGRYGDFEKILRETGEYEHPGVALYVAARKNPSDANVAQYMDFLIKNRTNPEYLSLGIQGLGEMNRVSEIYALLAAAPIETVLKDQTYILFRPWLAAARRDPRFMVIAKRLGLMSYWQKSGHWPDFCSDPGLRYDCKGEAARLSALTKA